MAKINVTEINSYLTNYISYDIKNKHLYAYRFTKEQLEVFKKDPLFEVLSNSGSGIFLEFKTTGNKIKFKLKKASFSKLLMFGIYKLGFSTLLDMALNARHYQIKYGNKAKLKDYIEIFVNNNLIYSRPINRKKIKVKFNNENNNKVNVKVLLPLYFPTGIKWFKTNKQIFKVHNQKDILLSLGDSITQGFNANQPSQNYTYRLSRILKMNVINQGLGSHYFDFESLKKLPIDPKIITVLYGTNDFEAFNNLDTINNNIKSFLIKLNELYPNKEIYIISPLWRKDYDEILKLKEINKIRSFIEIHTNTFKNMQFVNGLELIDHDEQYFSDGYLHPNQSGFDQMALRLSKIINNQ